MEVDVEAGQVENIEGEQGSGGKRRRGPAKRDLNAEIVATGGDLGEARGVAEKVRLQPAVASADGRDLCFRVEGATRSEPMTDRNEPAYPWGKNARGGLTKIEAAAIAYAQGMVSYGWRSSRQRETGNDLYVQADEVADSAVRFAIALFDRLDAQQAYDEDRIPDVPHERLVAVKQETIDYATAFLRRIGEGDAANKLAKDWEIPF